MFRFGFVSKVEAASGRLAPLAGPLAPGKRREKRRDAASTLNRHDRKQSEGFRAFYLRRADQVRQGIVRD